MSIETNIANAVKVLGNTYASVDKLMQQADGESLKAGYGSVSPRFLRWKSDVDPWGWFITSFIKLYQKATAPELDNGFRAGSIYGFQINLEPEVQVILFRNDYPDLSLVKGISPANHWVFYWPNYEGPVKADFKITPKVYEGRNYKESVTIGDIAKKNYWNMDKSLFIEGNLVDIDAKNIQSRIFAEFDFLGKIL